MTSTKEYYLLENAYYGYVRKIPTSYFEKAYDEFINHYVKSSVSKTLILRNISNAYVCMGLKLGENYLREGENTWTELIKDDPLLRRHMENGATILGYIIFEEDEEEEKEDESKIKFISFIDTRLRGYNIGTKMIEKFLKQNHKKYKMVLPREIIPDAVGYWVKYFEQDLEDLGVDVFNLETLNEFRRKIKKDVKWDPLFKHYEGMIKELE